MEKTGDLISIHEFANRYRVDVSIVRNWIRRGVIPYKMVGRRMMLRIGDIPRVVRPVKPVNVNRQRLATWLVQTEGIDIDTANTVIDSMEQEEVDGRMLNIDLGQMQSAGDTKGEDDGVQEIEGREDNPPRPAGAGKGADDRSKRRTPPRRSR